MQTACTRITTHSRLPIALGGGFRFMATPLIATMLVACAANGQSACDADANGDGAVGSADITQVLSDWGACAGCSSDFNRDGIVDAADITILLSFWGSPCEPLSWASVIEFAPNAEVVSNAGLRRAIAATGLPWRVRDNASGIEMLLVPPGAFAMGCSSGAGESCFVDEFPVHAVALTEAFYIGRFEVTQGEWTAVTGSNPAYFCAPAYPDGAARPVERVTLAMIGAFLKHTGLRLPTEAEWEYAYRGGATTPFHSTAMHPDGIDDPSRVGDIAWYEGNNGELRAADWGTKRVGTKAANALGVHDMAGNISEWVSDWYGGYPEEPQIDPTGPETGSDRILRGGDWMSPAYFLRASVRSAIWADTANLNHGFRVARHP